MLTAVWIQNWMVLALVGICFLAGAAVGLFAAYMMTRADGDTEEMIRELLECIATECPCDTCDIDLEDEPDDTEVNG